MESRLKGKTIKPSEYPERMLKALVAEYDKGATIKERGMPLSILNVKAGITENHMTNLPNGGLTSSRDSAIEGLEALRIMEEKGWVRRVIMVPGEIPHVLPTEEGLAYGRFLNRPRAYRWIRSGGRDVFVAVIEGIARAFKQ